MTDLDEITRQDLQKTIDYLNTIYLDLDIENNKSIIKEVNKTYIIFSIWRNNLDINNKVFLYDILYNLCSIVHSILLKDEKIINFTLRNTIESSLRYITQDVKSERMDDLFEQVKEKTNDNSRKDILDNLSVLKQEYDFYCNFVHSNPRYIDSQSTNLALYKNKDFDLQRTYESFRKIFRSLNNLFKYIYIDKYLKLKINARTVINLYTLHEDRVKFSQYSQHYIGSI